MLVAALAGAIGLSSSFHTHCSADRGTDTIIALYQAEQSSDILKNFFLQKRPTARKGRRSLCASITSLLKLLKRRKRHCAGLARHATVRFESRTVGDNDPFTTYQNYSTSLEKTSRWTDANDRCLGSMENPTLPSPRLHNARGSIFKSTRSVVR